MIFQNMEFHNVECLEERLGGYMLQRFPEEVRFGLGYQDHDRGRMFSQMPVGCEIRFVTDAHFFRISLASYEKDNRIFVFRGNFLQSVLDLPAGKISSFHIEEPAGWSNIETEAFRGHRFSSQVWRIVMDKESSVLFYGADFVGHPVRPPQKEEVPTKEWMAYGSSITFGGDAHLGINAYAMRTARLLDLDLYNKSIAGSCFCDVSVVEYLAKKAPQMDLVTCELGINMLRRFPEEVFKERTYHLIGRLREAAPETKIAVITPFTAGAAYQKDESNEGRTRYYAFTDILKAYPDPAVTVWDGREILKDFSGLSADLVHPSDEGHAMMAMELANKIKKII